MQSFASVCWSAVSNMTKSLPYPSLLMCFWYPHMLRNVPTQISPIFSPSMRRLHLSAALLVKVIASIDEGWTGLSLMMLQSLPPSGGCFGRRDLRISSRSASTHRQGRALNDSIAVLAIYAILCTAQSSDPAPARPQRAFYLENSLSLLWIHLSYSFSSSFSQSNEFLPVHVCQHQISTLFSFYRPSIISDEPLQ